MRATLSLLALLAFLCGPKSYAQTEPRPLAPGARPSGPQQPVQQYRVEDGGTREVLESINPSKGERSVFLAAANRMGQNSAGRRNDHFRKSTSHRARYQRTHLPGALVPGPQKGKMKSQMTTIQISDPNAHTLYNCFMLDGMNQCVLSSYSPSTSAVYNFQGPPTGKLTDDAGSVIHEDLGKQLVAGMETTSTRDSVIYNPNVFGNDRKMTIEREFWYSPKLGINLISKRSDPRIGTQIFTTTNLILSEPDPKLFDLPDGYKVVDRRQSLPPEN